MIQKLIWEIFSVFAVKKITKLVNLFLSVYTKQKPMGQGKAPAELLWALGIWHRIKRTHKRAEAKFCDLESGKTTVKWVFSELTAAEISPWEPHLQGPGVRSVEVLRVFWFR